MPTAAATASAAACLPTAMVTGASSGIGREVAVLLARRGYRLYLVARRAERLEDLARQLSCQTEVVTLALDLSQPQAVEEVLARLEGNGPVEVLVNNAGFGLYQSFLEHSPEDFRRLMEVHYFAAVGMIRSLLPPMLERRRGHVINIGSVAAKMGPWGHAGYAAAKSALTALTQTLAAECRGTGVRFSYVTPGIVDTEYFDHPSYASLFPRIRRHAITPEKAARKIVGLLDRPRLELCIPGHYRVMDWFRAMSPSLTHFLVTLTSRPRCKGGGPGKAPPAGSEDTAP